MKLDNRQIIAKLRAARGLLREVQNSFEGFSLDNFRCSIPINELDLLLDYFRSNEV